MKLFNNIFIRLLSPDLLPEVNSLPLKGAKFSIKCGHTRKYTPKFFGQYKDEIETSRVYDHKTSELFGEFTYLDFRDILPGNRYI